MPHSSHIKVRTRLYKVRRNRKINGNLKKKECTKNTNCKTPEVWLKWCTFKSQEEHLLR